MCILNLVTFAEKAGGFRGRRASAKAGWSRANGSHIFGISSLRISQARDYLDEGIHVHGLVNNLQGRVMFTVA